jgi:HSP20 family molecular chaperone IbpA
MRYNNIFSVIDSFFDGVDPFQLFNFVPSRQIFELTSKNFPPTNIEIDSNKVYHIDIALAGVEEKDIYLIIEGRYIKLKIDTHKKLENGDKTLKEGEEITSYVVQRGIKHLNYVENSYLIPKQFNLNGLNAKYKNGLLSITIPANEEVKQIPEVKQIKLSTE